MRPKDHCVLEYDESLLCERHGRDLKYICVDCRKAKCSLCVLQQCYHHEHDVITITGAIDRFFQTKAKYEHRAQFISDNRNYTAMKDSLNQEIDKAVEDIRCHSGKVIKSMERETGGLSKALTDLRTGALNILEATKKAADVLERLSYDHLYQCERRMPLDLFDSLPVVLRPEVRQSHDSCAVESITFHANADVSIGELCVSLSKLNDAVDQFEGKHFPQIYDEQVVCTNPSPIGKLLNGRQHLCFTLKPDKRGHGEEVGDLFNQFE